MLPLLEKIAAKDFTGKPCVTYVGKAAAGNFVKMVHNGIEYALMQGIAEIYDILRSANMSQSDIQHVFRELNTGLTKSFLLDITVDILGTKDTDGADLLTKISDIAGSKGTGWWTVEAALKLGVSVPSIGESLFARWLSGRKEKANLPTKTPIVWGPQNTTLLKQALKTTYLASYLQWIELILVAETEWNWEIDIQEVLRIWQWWCIIRSEMLRTLPAFYRAGKVSDTESTDIEAMLWETKETLNNSHTPTPVLSSSYNYMITRMSDKLPTNLIQAMRDSFWAHGVKRIGSDISENFSWK